MDLTVKIDKNLPSVVPDAISFETGATRAEMAASPTPVYEHHGAEFSPLDKGALPLFFEELILGRPLPTLFATKRIQDLDTLTAIALFLHRDLALHPSTPAWVMQVDFIHRLGLPALSHLDDTFARFVCAIRDYFPDKGLSQRELSDRLKVAVGWVRQYIQDGTFALTGLPAQGSIRVLDQGTNGFVIAETSGNLYDGWVSLYRMGFLRGVLISPAHEDKRRILIARKSLFLAFNLQTAGQILNQMEAAMGELPGWQVSQNELWLAGPEDGSLILPSDLLKVLIRL